MQEARVIRSLVFLQYPVAGFGPWQFRVRQQQDVIGQRNSIRAFHAIECFDRPANARTVSCALRNHPTACSALRLLLTMFNMRCVANSALKVCPPRPVDTMRGGPANSERF
jgi:hypothetical protein